MGGDGLFGCIGFCVCWNWGISAIIGVGVGEVISPPVFFLAEVGPKAPDVEGTGDIAQPWAFLVIGPTGLSGLVIFGLVGLSVCTGVGSVCFVESCECTGWDFFLASSASFPVFFDL